jgi:hypothetical protein
VAQSPLLYGFATTTLTQFWLFIQMLDQLNATGGVGLKRPRDDSEAVSLTLASFCFDWSLVNSHDQASIMS